MTGMPCRRALSSDDSIDARSGATTMSTVAPLAIRRSIFDVCGACERVASFEKYLPPAAATMLWIAGSSHLPNRSVLIDQDTPTTQPSRVAGAAGDAGMASTDAGTGPASAAHPARTIAVAHTNAAILRPAVMLADPDGDARVRRQSTFPAS